METGNRRNLQHGGCYLKEHQIWRSMRQRCANPRAQGYERYGGRGITVCKRWEKFENFFADMGPKPEGYSLERKKNSKGYSPGNCVWAPRIDQQNNMRSNRRVTAQGMTLTVAQWSRKTGINPRTLLKRLQLGWDPERAVTEKPRAP